MIHTPSDSDPRAARKVRRQIVFCLGLLLVIHFPKQGHQNRLLQKGTWWEPARGSELTGRHPKTSVSGCHTSERVRRARLLVHASGLVPDATLRLTVGGWRHAYVARARDAWQLRRSTAFSI